jgi:hypothetical protein
LAYRGLTRPSGQKTTDCRTAMGRNSSLSLLRNIARV